MMQMVDLNDTYYIGKVLQGDKAAFSWLVDHYSDMVYSIALKLLKNTADAEDLAQEVFISAFQSLKDYRGSSKFSTWLYRITFNKAISKLRKKSREIFKDNDKQLEIRGEDEFYIDGVDEAEEKLKVLEKVIGKLNDDEQLLIMLYYFEEQSVEEIAAITRISVSNVKVKLFRIRKRMKEMYERMDQGILHVID